jgi:hypothetical protein
VIDVRGKGGAMENNISGGEDGRWMAVRCESRIQLGEGSESAEVQL